MAGRSKIEKYKLESFCKILFLDQGKNCAEVTKALNLHLNYIAVISNSSVHRYLKSQSYYSTVNTQSRSESFIKKRRDILSFSTRHQLKNNLIFNPNRHYLGDPCLVQSHRNKSNKTVRYKKGKRCVLCCREYYLIKLKDPRMRLGYDPQRFYLGILCKRGHKFRGRNKSLRYKSNYNCVVCKREDWNTPAEKERRKLRDRKRKRTTQEKERRRLKRKDIHYQARRYLARQFKIKKSLIPENLIRIKIQQLILHRELRELKKLLKKQGGIENGTIGRGDHGIERTKGQI